MRKSLIVVITPSSSQPRFHKRISALSKISDIIVFSFRRGLYEVNDFQPGVQIFDLGKIIDRNYLKRILPFFRAVRILNRNLPGGYKTIQFYAFSIDCLLVAKLAGIKIGFLEIGDLILMNTSKKWLRFLEKLILRHINGLVLTSKEFFNQYYSILIQNNGKPSVFIIENKIPPSLIQYRIRNKLDISEINGPITVGLVGFLRYEIPILRLVKFVNDNPELVSLKVFGDGPYKLLIQDHASKSIMYYGSFKNPDELPKIYGDIDLNYVVYDNHSLNVRLAIPNKLYESAFFQVPLICSPNTYLSQLTTEWGIGDAVRIDTQNNFDNDMKKIINPKWINSKTSNCSNLSNSILIDQQEKVLKNMFKRERT